MSIDTDLPTATRATPAADGRRYSVRAVLVLVCVLTVFDAAASWVSIELLGVAVEGNGVLRALSDVIGFTGTMIVRAVWGIGLCVLLAHFAARARAARGRTLAYRGLVVIAVILGILAGYHVALFVDLAQII